MPFSEIFSDFFSSLSFQEVHAEAPQADEDSEDKGEEAGEGEDKSEGGEEGEKEEGGDDEGGEDGGDDEGADDEEEEEEEEPEDIKPKLEEGVSILVMAVTPLQVSVVSASFESPVRDLRLSTYCLARLRYTTHAAIPRQAEGSFSMGLSLYRRSMRLTFYCTIQNAPSHPNAPH